MPRALKDILWIFIPTTIISALFFIFDLDASLSRLMYEPENNFAYFVRQYSNIPGAILTVFSILFLLSPWANKLKILRRNTLLWLFTVVLGGGVFVHVILKESVDRPRPRDGVLIEYQAELTGNTALAEKAKLSGKSFPSGHTAMAAAFIIPFFTLRRRKTKTAITLLTFALFYTGVVSWARMTLGAHFFLDCLWGFSVVAMFAALGAWFIKEETKISRLFFAGFLLFSLFCVAWFNKFKITLSHTVLDPELSLKIDLPCEIDMKKDSFKEKRTLLVELKGYGAPLSWLSLKEKDGKIMLERRFGVYRDLSCQAKVVERF